MKGILYITTLVFLAKPLFGQPAMTPEQWGEDLSYYLEEVTHTHIAPFNKVSREEFSAAVADLSDQVKSLQQHQIIVVLARITSLLGDGHSTLWLTPDDANGFHQFAILPYWMEDELYVLGIDERYAELSGGRIVRIGEFSTAEAMRRTAPLVPHDNLMGIRHIAPRYLACPEILNAIGITPTVENVKYTIERSDGQVQEITLEAIPGSWLFELPFIPWLDSTGDGRTEINMAYDTTAPPLWLKHPERIFWSTEIPGSNALYVQLNQIQNSDDESMEAFFERVLTRADSLRPERLILDLRLNGGGNNMLNLPVVLKFVRRTWLDQRGKFFVLISRHTFSAASHLVTYLERLTNAVFVGEPTGGSPNHYGDPDRIILPNCGLTVRASTMFWQNSLPEQFEKRTWTAPDLAAPLTIDAYRSGMDPALELALGWIPEPELAERLQSAILSGRMDEADASHRAYSSNPLYRWVDNEDALNLLGYGLLAGGRLTDAVAIFRMNTEDHPASANAFDSFGDGLLAAGDTTAAIAAWREALRIDSTFASSAANLRRLKVEP